MTDMHDSAGSAAPSIDAVQLSEQLALAGELSLEVMHDIRNPLETLSYLTYLTAAEANDEAMVRKYMGLAEQELTRMRSIVKHTLGLARASEAAPVDLVALAETALRIHQREIDRKRIALRRKLPTSLVIRAQHGPLLQVVSNLIVNALEAMEETGFIHLRLRKRGNEVDLVVGDTGHGIAAEALTRLGERGFTTKPTGNGLGLALSKRIVAQHKGRVRVRSCVRPGRSGTVFRITLPTGDGAEQNAAASVTA